MNSQFYPAIPERMEELVQLLREKLGEEFGFIDAFTDEVAATPIYRPTATVGIRSMEVRNTWLLDLAGRQDDENCYGKLVEVIFEVTIHAPVSYGGYICRGFFCKLRDALNESDTFRITRISAGEIAYDRSRRCLCMPIDLQEKYIL